jgi:hypothetical protein
MLDEPNFFWKNFRLGTELQIAGSFIYNALFDFENMETFYYEHECFEFLYNASVGLERLQKIAVILIEHDSNQSQDAFEKSLITHNHLLLLDRIKKKRRLKLGKLHNKFLALLDTFYNTVRYDRYSLTSVYRPPQDQRGLVDFISNGLKIEIKTGLPFSTGVTPNIKKFIGKIIGKIATELYDLIDDESHRLQTYTYEIAYQSKAFKIFVAKEFDFIKEKLMQREVALFLFKNLPNDQLKQFIDNIDPLDFEQLHTNKYFNDMFNFHKNRSAMDEMEYLYEEKKLKYSRVKQVMILGSDTNFDYFGDLDELEDEQ